MNNHFRIKNFPVSFFSVVMGLSGLVIALEKASEIYGLSSLCFELFFYLTVAIFIMISLFYLKKIISYPREVKKEFNHPIKINFFPAFSISLLLLSIAFLPVNIVASKYLWTSGALIHLVLTLMIVSAWIEKKTFETKHMNPSWFIPAVGNILVPIAGVVHFPAEISWLFFSAGFIFWIILMVIFFNRVFFHEPLPEKLLPTLFILIAPPAVGFVAYYKLSESLNDFGRVLYFFAMFILLLLFSQFRMYRKIKFYLSWWAYSFPLAAAAISNALMYEITNQTVYKNIFAAILLLLILLIVVLSVKTTRAIYLKEICIEE